ncbi:MAG: single-stranded-DNA-specific exonuclease RecJ [Ignavibacteriales bacterium]|nr:single-stranded-DNA-specific exonuclease RecJ [Ignavibacteriales bacterium]
MKKKRWVLKRRPDQLEVQLLADSLSVSESLARLLVFRKIKTFQQARRYFRPTLEFLHDPFLMSGMEEASLRVIEAITSNEKIVVYGDYDVDGACSTALMYLFLRELGANVSYFIPNRLKDGYGISRSGVDLMMEKNATLVISVDCGITAVEEVAYAREHGVDFIISDHHQPKDTLPPAFAVLDPLKPGDQYPFKYLAGAGVAFKLAQAVSERIGKRELPFKYLDLVALAGAADIVPLVDENRIMARLGLDQINNAPRAGLRALLESSRLGVGGLTSGQIVFSLAPRINAVGRMSDAKVAVELLVTQDYDEARKLAKVLEEENSERRRIDEDTLNAALDRVEELYDAETDRAIVLHGDDWHPGVVGIVASRLVEKYYRPTVMLTTVDGVAKGSARSIQNFNIYETLRECEDLLLHFGGHQAAAGLSLEIGRIDEFRERFNRLAGDRLSDEDLIPNIEIDSKIRLSEITPKFLRIVNQFAPFGPQNPRPVFLLEDARVAGRPRIVGHNHLLFSVKQDGCDKVFDAIGFNFGEYAAPLQNGVERFDLVFGIDKLFRDGRTYPQFKVRDIQLNEE